ncbi:MAG: hypothetical protein FWC46_06895 [Actinomycetia bacterium]|nr:hypothetical protein [Actinomycetes bacterium]
MRQRAPEMGRIVYKDPGRFPGRALATWAPVSAVVLGLYLPLRVRLTTGSWEGALSPTNAIVFLASLILICGVIVAVTWKGLVVCERGLVRYLRVFGSRRGAMVTVPYEGLLVATLQTTDDVKGMGTRYVARQASWSYTPNDWSWGPGIAFLGRTWDVPAVMARYGMTLADDPRAGLLCWVHATAGNPDKTMTAILNHLASQGNAEARDRLRRPLSFHDSLWEQLGGR